MTPSFIFKSRDLRAALARCSGVVGRSTTLPILSHVLLKLRDQTEIVATDLDVWVTAHCASEAKGEADICLPLRKLAQILDVSGDEVSIAVEKQSAAIKSGAAVFRVSSLPPGEFPPHPSPPKPQFDLTQPEMLAAIKKVRHAIGQDCSQYIMQGIHWQNVRDGLLFEATDGRRLARTTLVHTQAGIDFILPQKACQIIAANLEPEGPVSIGVDEYRISVVTPECSIISKLIEGCYPNSSQVIPAPATEIKLNVKELVAVCNQAALAVDDRNVGVKIVIKDGILAVSTAAELTRLESSTMAVEYNGKPICFNINVQYFMEGLSMFLEHGSIILNYTDELSPINLLNGRDLEVVVPLRMS